MSVPQLITYRALARSRASVTRRVNSYLKLPGRVIAACEICPRYVRVHLVSDRGWCPQCEREFVQVMASLRRRGVVTRAA